MSMANYVRWVASGRREELVAASQSSHGGVKVCGECGCAIVAKAALADEQCPLGKWKGGDDRGVQRKKA